MNLRNAFRLACALAVSVWVPAAFAALGDACHWTGNGGNAYWTNSLNWAEGRVPGRYLVPDPNQSIGYSTNGVVGEVAIFGDDLVTGCATNIDFSGVYSISNLVTTGTAHRYIYGVTANQYVPLEPWGRFTVAELANTPVARVPAKIRCGVELRNGLYNSATGKWTNWYGKETIKFRNNSATEEFVFENSWGNAILAAFRSSGGGQTGIQFEGTGDFRISYAYNNGYPFFYDCLTTGKLTIDIKFATRSFELLAPGEGYPADSTTVRQVEITANGALASSEGNQTNFAVSRPVRFYGEGYLAFAAGWAAGTYWHCGGISLNADAIIECPVKFRITSAKNAAFDSYPYRMAVTGNTGYKLLMTGSTTIGTELVLSNWTIVDDTATATALRQNNGNMFTLRSSTFADGGPYGAMEFQLSGNSTVLHEGSEASEMTRSLVITNVTTGAKAARLKQGGTGAWTVSSSVSTAASISESTLYLSATDVAGLGSATFAGTVDDKVTVVPEYGGNWTFSPSDGKCAKLALPGGKMSFGARAITVNEISATVGATVLMVPNGCTLNVGKLVTAADKTVDFVLCGTSAQVKVNPAAANVVTGLKLNGHPATLDAEGHLQMIAGSVNIWKLPVSGDWTDATKWAGSVAADPFRETYVDVIGGAYTVTVDNVESTITNLYVGNQLGEAVKLVLTNGTKLTVSGRTHLQSILQLQPGASVEVASSDLELFNRGNSVGASSTYSTLKLNGGSISVSGSGSLTDHGIQKAMRTDGKNDNLNGFFTFGTGSVEFRDQATFKTRYEESHTVFYHYVKPDKAGETARVTFRDQAHFAFPGSPYQI